MQKDYNIWHKRKKYLHNEKQAPFFHEREVWFCHVDENVGFEQDGVGEQFLRPVVVVRKFNSQIFWGVPTTKKNKKSEFYFRFSYHGRKSTSAILSQLRLVDSKRLLYRIGFMNEADFVKVRKLLTSFLK